MRRQTLREQALDTLRSAIQTGVLKPGAKISEPELAAQYKISRTPIREAIRQLEMEGYIEVSPHRGARVAKILTSDFKDFFDVRAILEGYAVHRACGRIAENDLRRMRVILDQMRQNVEVSRAKGNMELYQEFHKIILIASRNRHLQKSVEAMMNRSWDICQMFLTDQRVMDILNGYEQVITAIEANRPKIAEQAITITVHLAKEIIQKRLLATTPTIPNS